MTRQCRTVLTVRINVSVFDRISIAARATAIAYRPEAVEPFVLNLDWAALVLSLLAVGVCGAALARRPCGS